MVNFFKETVTDRFGLHIHIVLKDSQLATVVRDLFKTFINDMKKSHEKDDQGTEHVTKERKIKSHTNDEATKDIKDEPKTKLGTSAINVRFNYDKIQIYHKPYITNNGFYMKNKMKQKCCL